MSAVSRLEPMTTSSRINCSINCATANGLAAYNLHLSHARTLLGYAVTRLHALDTSTGKQLYQTATDVY